MSRVRAVLYCTSTTDCRTQDRGAAERTGRGAARYLARKRNSRSELRGRGCGQGAYRAALLPARAGGAPVETDGHHALLLAEPRQMTAAKRAGSPMFKEENMKTFVRFIAERQRVYLRWYARAPTPWTHDPTISNSKFTNVFRFLDRESVWLVAHIINPLRDRPADLLFNGE